MSTRGGAGREGRTVAAFLFGSSEAKCILLSLFFFSCFTGRCFFFNSEEFASADRSGRTLCNAENLTFPSC